MICLSSPLLPLGVRDTTSYLQEGDFILTPGVWVSSATGTDEGPYDTELYSTNVGILLQNSNDRVGMITANHSFPRSTQLFHRMTGYSKFGDITER